MNILKFAFIGGLLLLAGCETTSSIPYEVSTSNIMKMRANVVSGNTVRVEGFDIANGVNQNPMCRLLGPVKVSPGKTIMQFVKDAFEKELYESGLLDLNSPVVIQGRLEKMEFSSVSPASWDLTLRLQSNNGATLTVTNKYAFATSFSAYGACKNVADAFGPAVQILLGKAIENPDFPSLFARNDSLKYSTKAETNSSKADEIVIEQTLEPERPASGFDISGTYVSEITSNSHWQFTKRYQNLTIIFTQKGNKIIGIDQRYDTKIEATIAGDVVNFYVLAGQASGGYDAKGEWKISSDGTRLEGTWIAPNSADAAAGDWTLRKTQ